MCLPISDGSEPNTSHIQNWILDADGNQSKIKFTESDLFGASVGEARTPQPRFLGRYPPSKIRN